MTLKQLAERVAALEAEVAALKAAHPPAANSPRSWLDGAGQFRNDPAFAEIVRLGREYRESLRPGGAAKSKARNKVTA